MELTDEAISTPADSTPWNELLRVVGESGSCLAKPEAVREYLAQFPDVAPVVANHLRAARTEFGNSAQVFLDLYRDPEIDDEYLRVRVRLSHYGEDFLRRLRSISDARDEDLSRISGYVSVTTDYHPAALHGAV